VPSRQLSSSFFPIHLWHSGSAIPCYVRYAFENVLLRNLKISESYRIVRYSADKGISRFYRTRRFVTIKRRPLLESITNQFNEVNIFTVYFSNNRFNIILPLRLCVPSSRFPSEFRTTIFNAFTFSPWVSMSRSTPYFSI
jgi:hypothetical protein